MGWRRRKSRRLGRKGTFFVLWAAGISLCLTVVWLVDYMLYGYRGKSPLQKLQTSAVSQYMGGPAVSQDLLRQAQEELKNYQR